jgi:hypothetical protein
MKESLLKPLRDPVGRILRRFAATHETLVLDAAKTLAASVDSALGERFEALRSSDHFNFRRTSLSPELAFMASLEDSTRLLPEIAGLAYAAAANSEDATIRRLAAGALPALRLSDRAVAEELDNQLTNDADGSVRYAAPLSMHAEGPVRLTISLKCAWRELS